MQKAFVSLLFLLLPLAAKAQDTIVYKTGDEIQAQVTKISGNEVEYKKWSNLNGPVYSSPTSEIFMIKFQNGDKEVFKDQAPAQAAAPDPSRPQLVELPPDAHNAEIIESYKFALDDVDFSKLKQKNSVANNFICFWNIHPKSKLSNSEIELQVVPCVDVKTKGTTTWDNTFWLPPRTDSRWNGYYLKLTNKTGDNIYIDKANCFRIDQNGISECYFDNKIQTVSQGGQSGAAVNLGGVARAFGASGAVSSLASAVTVGGSSGGVSSTTYADSRYLSIPPFGSSFLQEDNYVEVKGSGLQNMGSHEDFNIRLSKSTLNKNEVMEFSPDDFLYSYRILITYSTKADFSTYSKLEIWLYVRKMMGVPSSGSLYVDSGFGIMENIWGSRVIQLPEDCFEELIMSNVRY